MTPIKAGDIYHTERHRTRVEACQDGHLWQVEGYHVEIEDMGDHHLLTVYESEATERRGRFRI